MNLLAMHPFLRQFSKGHRLHATDVSVDPDM